eukprot:CAMPEP_0172547076 /NCGR_PEP_ID=MMETSP1067-20121228/16692_1 /TAXON_ID=265564 ORGANISM="Thalassiosira punctigera, Strain Tpunct2005C2" /NCGR_SAMPLE_ID=MMETSP1067 /ASSEMBLY_ACC=CAM_ASM_000444 /LENGTH=354 /DNA_ID=CAMNT_0013334097 /DNA_START=211 /DNA_END=1275 /DNA_ORIENTATION=-
MSELSPAHDRSIPRAPLEIHSPNVRSPSRFDRDFEMKSPSRVLAKGPCPLMPAADGAADCRGGERRDENEETFRLSPVGRGPANYDAPMNVSDASNIGDDFSEHDDGVRAMNDGGCERYDRDGMDASFPDDSRFEIQSPERYYEEREEEHEDDDDEEHDEEESEEERLMREMEESEALARMLMAEEAMASYAMSTEYLRENADQFSGEDLAALQAAMAEENPDLEEVAEEGDGDNSEGESEEERGGMSYDALLSLGERIGSVKEERWALIARKKIEEHCPTLTFAAAMAEGKEENHTEVKCQVCQFPYEEGDELRRLPCGHCFHKECVEQWLSAKDACAFCRKSIVDDEDQTTG